GVAEEHAGVAVGEVGDAREGFRADEEHVLESAGDEHRRADDELVREPGTAGVEVERAAAKAEPVADERAGMGDGLLGRGGGDDQKVDRVGGQACVLDRRGAGFDRERRGRFARSGDPSLTDAGALDDPHVRGVDSRLEVGVGEALLRNRGSPAGDARSHAQASRSHATGCPSRRRSPGWTRMPTRRPRNGLQTGVDVPGPSSSPTAWPSSTNAPSSSVSNGRNTPTAGATIMRSGTSKPSPWVNRASMVSEPPSVAPTA